jgi:hypothetical protein
MRSRIRLITMSLIGVAAVMVAAISVAPALSQDSKDEGGYETPPVVDNPWSVVPTFSPEELKRMEVDPKDIDHPTPITGPISDDQAREIGLRVASLKGDPNATLTSLEVRSLGEAIRELSPGMELYGYSMDMQVYDVRFSGGPFEHGRSKPISRPDFDTSSNDLFVVISVETGEVIGTGALEK